MEIMLDECRDILIGKVFGPFLNDKMAQAREQSSERGVRPIKSTSLADARAAVERAPGVRKTS